MGLLSCIWLAQQLDLKKIHFEQFKAVWKHLRFSAREGSCECALVSVKFDWNCLTFKISQLWKHLKFKLTEVVLWFHIPLISPLLWGVQIVALATCFISIDISDWCSDANKFQLISLPCKEIPNRASGQSIILWLSSSTVADQRQN